MSCATEHSTTMQLAACSRRAHGTVTAQVQVTESNRLERTLYCGPAQASRWLRRAAQSASEISMYSNLCKVYGFKSRGCCAFPFAPPASLADRIPGPSSSSPHSHREPRRQLCEWRVVRLAVLRRSRYFTRGGLYSCTPCMGATALYSAHSAV